MRVSNPLNKDLRWAKKCELGIQAYALFNHINPDTETDGLTEDSHLCSRLYLHKWEFFVSLDDWASFTSFLAKGLARLLCFFEVALAILLTLSGVFEAGVYGGKIKLWLRSNAFQTVLPSYQWWWYLCEATGRLKADDILLLFIMKSLVFVLQGMGSPFVMNEPAFLDAHR